MRGRIRNRTFKGPLAEELEWMGNRYGPLLQYKEKENGVQKRQTCDPPSESGART